MATLKGPCFSLKARGSLASTIVYSGCRKTNVLRTMPSKSSRRYLSQAGHRNMLAYLAAAWTQLVPTYLASWVNNVPASEASPYHWFIKTGMERWRRGLGPTENWQHYSGAAAAAIDGWGTVKSLNWIRLTIDTSTRDYVKAVMWHRGPGPGFSPTPANCFAVVTDRKSVV